MFEIMISEMAPRAFPFELIILAAETRLIWNIL